MDTNYLCEQKLKRENPHLHKLFGNSVFCVQQMLVKYQNIFPTYTDHTALHSLEVIDFCNHLIGRNIDQMNADEIYVLLMAAYLHDSGMGITMSDYENFRKRIDFEDYFDTHSQENIPDIIRDFHQEKSMQNFLKYRHRNIFLQLYRFQGDTEKQICGIQKHIRKNSTFQMEIRFICPIWHPLFVLQTNSTLQLTGICNLCMM